MREVIRKVLLVGLLAVTLWCVTGCATQNSGAWGEDTKAKLEAQK